MKGGQSQQKSFEQLIFMALYKLSKLRCSQLFLNPVSIELYPDYLSIITCPMDIQTIMNKFKSGNYSLICQIYEDLLLIGKNYFEYSKHEWSQENNKTISRWIKSMDAGWNVLKKQLIQLGYKEDNKIFNNRQVSEKILFIEEKLKLAYIKKIGKIKDNGCQIIQQRKTKIGGQQTSQISTNSKRTKINCVPRINNTAEIIQKIQVSQSNNNLSQNSITNPSPRIGRLTRSKNIQNPNNYSFGINNQYVDNINHFDESRSKTRSGSRNSKCFSPQLSVEQNTNARIKKREKKLIKQLKDLRKEQKWTNRKEQSHKSDQKIGWSQDEDIIEQTILINKKNKPEKVEEKQKEIHSVNQIEQKVKKRTIQEQPQPELISILSSLIDEDQKHEKAAESQGQNTETVGLRQQTQTYHRRSYTQTIQKVQSTFTISKSNHDEGESYERRSQPAQPTQHCKFDLQYRGQNSQTENKQKYCKVNKPVQVATKISIRFQYEEPANNLKSKGTDSNSQNEGVQDSQPNTDKVSEQQSNHNLIKHKLKKCRLILKNCIKWIYKHMIKVQPTLICPDVQHAQYLHKPSTENEQIYEQIEQCEECIKYKKQNQLLKQLKSLKSYQHLQLSIHAQMYNLSKGQVKLKNILILLKQINLWVKFVIPGDGIQNRNNRRFNKIYGWRLRDQYEQVQRNIIKSLQKIIQYKKLDPEFSLLLQQAIQQMDKQKQAAAHEKRYKNKNANNNKKNYRRITRSRNKITKQLLSQPSSIFNQNSKTSNPQKNEQLSKCQNPQACHINTQKQENKVEDQQQFIKILAKDGVYKGFRVVINEEQCSQYQTIKTLNKNQKKMNKYSVNVSNKQSINKQQGSDSSFHSQSQQENQKDILQKKPSRSKTKSKKKQVSFQSQSETENSSQGQDQFIPGTKTKRYKYARLKSLTKPQKQYLQHQHDQLNKKQEMQQDQLFIAQYSLRSNVCVLQKYGSKLVFDWEAKKRTIFGELPSVISF